MAEATIKNNSGFTLIELMIVVFVIGMMATLAISGYGQYRQATMLDFAVDSLVSSLDELRVKTSNGSFGEEKRVSLQKEMIDGREAEVLSLETSSCLGLLFLKSDNGFSSDLFSQNFSGERTWDSVNQEWVYEGCRFFDLVNLDKKPLELDKSVKVVSLEYNGKEVFNDFILRFSPPKGKIDYRIDSGVFVFGKSVDSLKIVFQYGDGADAARKILIYDLLTGNRKTTNN